MSKSEFLFRLSQALEGIPEKEKALAYYSEMIDDRMEDGMSEEEAVNSMESVESIRDKFIYETPFQNFIKEKASKPLSGVSIILIVLGFPVWFPLLIAAGAVAFSVFITVAALLISLYAVLISFALSGVFAIFSSALLFAVKPAAALFCIGSGLILIALSLLLVYPSFYAGHQLIRFMKFIGYKIKTAFVRRGRNAQ